MRKVCLLFLFSIQLAYGQKNPATIKEDSLELKFASERGNIQKLELLQQLVDISFKTDMQKALIYANQGVMLADKSKDKNWQPRFYEMVGRIHANLLHLDSADIFFDKAMEYYKAVGNERGQATTYFKKAWVYKKKGEIDKAMAADLKASSLMEALDDKTGMAASYEKISDDLTSQGWLKMLTEYEIKKNKATIDTQGREISQQRKVQWLGGGVVLLLMGILLFGFISYRNRSKSNRLLAAKNAENELLLQEIHHRVKNNLEVVSSLLALQSAQIDDVNTKEAMREGQNRIHSISIVHQKLYRGKNLGAIEMKDYFLYLSESILDSFGADERVKVELAMEKIDVHIDTAVPLGLIVNELLTNTLKYAFPEGKNGTVLIRLEKKINGILHLEVSDNGIGKSGITRGTGFGGQLISLLTRQLNGSMLEEAKDGTNFYFDFKPEKAA